MINLASHSYHDSWALLSLSPYITFSSPSLSMRLVWNITKCGDFPICIGNFVHAMYVPFTKCGAFQFLLGIFVHATYIPFQLPSVGLSGFFWEFSDVRTISTT